MYWSPPAYTFPSIQMLWHQDPTQAAHHHPQQAGAPVQPLTALPRCAAALPGRSGPRGVAGPPPPQTPGGGHR
eukprot:scaffold309121_cov18-Tisochrysis_lutea.AAC.1